jgi:CO dehydrogenase/acetyl-CoA synthase epsilon subunit
MPEPTGRIGSRGSPGARRNLKSENKFQNINAKFENIRADSANRKASARKTSIAQIIAAFLGDKNWEPVEGAVRMDFVLRLSCKSWLLSVLSPSLRSYLLIFL